jgi:hypothetical protein
MRDFILNHSGWALIWTSKGLIDMGCGEEPKRSVKFTTCLSVGVGRISEPLGFANFSKEVRFVNSIKSDPTNEIIFKTNFRVFGRRLEGKC